VVPESRLEQTEHGLVPMGEGWFVLNARDSRWYHAEGRSAVCSFEGEEEPENEFEQLGINVTVLNPRESMGMYHWEADQEDFLVLSGEAMLIIEGEERPLKAWDFVHCPPETKHIIVGAGSGPCVVIALGAREKSGGGKPGWGGYTFDETAAKYGASVEKDTTDPKEAYAAFTRRAHATYRDGWLPG
jgi:quercetin dioxygenase-like cupin family protein